MARDGIRVAHFAGAAMFGANGFMIGAWAPQIPLLLPRHGLTETGMGLLILGLGLGAIAAMLFSGRLIARFGARPVLRALGFMLVPMLPLVILAPDVPLLALAMMLFGAISGCMDVAMNANAIDVEKTAGRPIVSSFHGCWSLGGFLGGGLGSWLLVYVAPETQALAAAAVILVIVSIAQHFLEGGATGAPAVIAPQPVIPGRRPSLLPAEAGLWVLGFLALFSIAPEGAVLDWGALYLRSDLGATPAVAGLGYAFFSGTMAIGRFSGDAIRGRFGVVSTLRLSALVAAAGLLIAALAPVAWVAILGFALSGFGIANMVPLIFVAAGNWPGQSTGSSIAAVTMVGYLGILLAPAFLGFLIEHIGFRPTFLGVLILLVVVNRMAGRTAIAERPRRLEPLGDDAAG